MFHLKPIENGSEALAQRLKRKMVKISSNGDFIPLKWNWAETWVAVPQCLGENIKEIYDFDVKQDDVFIETIPKSGSTWLQEAAWLLLNNLDYEEAKRVHVWHRCIYIDLDFMYENRTENSVEEAKKLRSPRIIQSHLPPHLIPHQIWEKKTKVLYCARNPKDVMISFYHFISYRGAYDGSMGDFIDDFLSDQIQDTPYWPHVLSMWLMRDEPNVFFITYEEMKRDLRGVIKRLNSFLEKPDLSEAQMEKLLDHLSFKNMKANSQANPTDLIKTYPATGNAQQQFNFMRRGIVGSYKDELSEDNQTRINEWSEAFLKEHNITEADIFGAC